MTQKKNAEYISDLWTTTIFDLAGMVNVGEMDINQAITHFLICRDLHGSQDANAVSKEEAFARLEINLATVGLRPKEIDVILSGLRRGKINAGRLN